jgi:hypothetical protein
MECGIIHRKQLCVKGLGEEMQQDVARVVSVFTAEVAGV